MEQAPLRASVPRIETVGVYGPKSEQHSTVGIECFGCGQPLRPGDVTTLVPVVPANDLALRRAAKGLEFEAVTIEVHLACTGRPT